MINLQGKIGDYRIIKKKVVLARNAILTGSNPVSRSIFLVIFFAGILSKLLKETPVFGQGLFNE